LADIDAFKLAREVAMNKLETFIYDKRDKLYQVCDIALFVIVTYFVPNSLIDDMYSHVLN